MTRKKQIILPLLILGISVLIFSGLKYFTTPPKVKAKKNKVPIVSVQEVELAPLTLMVASYGIVNPKYETELTAQVNGEVVELSSVFVRGGFVEKGELLARIDPNDYEAALIEAQASMANAKAMLEQEIAQGKVAEEEWSRIQNSSPTPLSLRKPQLAQELARVKSAEAKVLVAQRNLERTQIRAPYDAIIDSRHIGLGSFVRIGTTIGTLSGTEVAEVRLPIADKELMYLENQGEQALVNLTADFSGMAKQWQAHIVRSEGVVDSQSRMSYLVAEIQDPYLRHHTEKQLEDIEILRFGTYVNAHIQGKEIPEATIFPRYLVHNEKVATLSDDNTLHYKNITVLRQDAGSVIVTQGLSQGDKLIISALDYPFEGMKLALPSKNINTADMPTIKKD